METTLTTLDNFGFKEGDIITISGEKTPVVIKKINSSTVLTIRDFYWYELAWFKIKFEIKDAFPFLFI